MQAHRDRHCSTEPVAQPLLSQHFVAVVDAPRCRRGAEIVDQVADVMQQCRADQGGIGAVRFGQRGALQRVLQLAHPLTAVIGVAISLEPFENLVDCVHRQHSRRHQNSASNSSISSGSRKASLIHSTISGIARIRSQ
jgi:hypothetical protein